MNVSLVMITADGKLRELPAMKLPISIGRGTDAKIRIPVPEVSRLHCELGEEDDELVVKDLKSSNGTYVNKERVKSRELLPGDLVCVGPVVLVVRIDGHPKVIDPIIAWANGGVAAGEGEDRPTQDGVPAWKDKPAAASAGAKPAPAKPAPKPAAKSNPDDSGDLSDIIADLSESDFDIDFGDEDGKKPQKK
ncbi:MAG: FHA domain-containing protein [Phycisphaerales bacterium]|nr:FHA domain-containing protein [Phycisphaerales bacterium]